MVVEIKNLLAQFSEILLSEEIKKKFVRDAISQVIGLPIDSGDIRIKSNTVYLKIKPIYRNEIFLKKDTISAKLRQYFSRKTPVDIR